MMLNGRTVECRGYVCGSKPKERSKYGGTYINIFSLSAGTEFHVNSGNWDCKIIKKEDGYIYLSIEPIGNYVKYPMGSVMWLSITIKPRVKCEIKNHYTMNKKYK